MSDHVIQLLAASVIAFFGSSYTYFIRYRIEGYGSTVDKKKLEGKGVLLFIIFLFLFAGFAFLIAAIIIMYSS